MSGLVEQIKSLYAEEQKRGFHPVTSTEELPTCYEAITAAWLTDALCRGVAGATVVDHALDGIDDGSSNRRRIRISYNEAGQRAGLPDRVFCKAAHGLANRIVLGLSNSDFAEITFYNRIRPHLTIEAPVSCFAKLDPASHNSIVVLVDLTDKVTSFCNHNTVMTRQRAESQMRLLAAMHGAGYAKEAVRRELEQFYTWPEYFTKTLDFGMQEGSEQGFIRAEEVVPPRLYRRQPEIWPATLESVNLHNRLPMTFCHGDVHLKNWYVANNDDMGLSDWQCAHRGHWGRDLAYTIATALTVEDRRHWDRDLIRLYLDRLHAAGGPKISFDEAWMHFRQQLMTALTWWTITLNPAPGMPDMQPLDVTLEFLRRIATAMDDVDTMDSFVGA